MTTKTRENERRDYGIIIILILLLGFVCIILASGWALRFSPSWKLNTNMGSNLDPNSDFLTSRPVRFIEPVDPAILTQPAWINLFLTPGISLATRTPMPTGIATLVPVKTNTPISTTPATITSTVAANPTNTLVYIPPASTKTPKPPPPPTDTPTNTPITSLISADLQITNTDNATNYDASVTSVRYIIVVSNAGPMAVTGATVTDVSSANLTSITWTCTPTGLGASCAVGTVSGDINDTVNLPVGASVTYTVDATVVGTSGPLVNTAMVSVPAGITDPTTSNNSATDTDLLIAASSFPPQLTSPDGTVLTMSTSSFLDLQLASSLTISSTSYIVYYPDPVAAPPALEMDAVILQISDGKNWYTILNWGDGAPNPNTDLPGFPPNTTDCTSEPDNCLIDVSLLTTNSPGITINLNGLIPAGTYSYIRIKSPANPPDTSNDGVSIDAITVFP